MYLALFLEWQYVMFKLLKIETKLETQNNLKQRKKHQRMQKTERLGDTGN